MISCFGAGSRDEPDAEKALVCLCLIALSPWPAGNSYAQLPGGGDASGWKAAVAPPTFWAHDFVDSVGTVIHLLHPDSFYGRQFELMKQKLLTARIMHVRDGAMDAHGGFWNGDQAARFQELGRAGIHVTFIFRLNISPEFVQGFPAHVSPAFEAYELPNELNLAGRSVPWPSALQAWMPIFYRYVKDNPATAAYPILGPSIADMGNDPYGQLGLQEGYFDFGNLHKYYRSYNSATAGYGGVASPCATPCVMAHSTTSYALETGGVSGTEAGDLYRVRYGTDVARDAIAFLQQKQARALVVTCPAALERIRSVRRPGQACPCDWAWHRQCRLRGTRPASGPAFHFVSGQPGVSKGHIHPVGCFDRVAAQVPDCSLEVWGAGARRTAVKDRIATVCVPGSYSSHGTCTARARE